MPTLGETASQVRVRALGEDEAYLVGALHLQSLLRAGLAPDPGPPTHVQAVARRWAQRWADLPAWVAEHDGTHVGIAIARVPALPHTDGAPRLIHASPLVDEGPLADAVCLALVRTVVAWAREGRAPVIEIAHGVDLPGPVLDAARADVHPGRLLSLPTRA